MSYYVSLNAPLWPAQSLLQTPHHPSWCTSQRCWWKESKIKHVITHLIFNILIFIMSLVLHVDAKNSQSSWPLLVKSSWASCGPESACLSAESEPRTCTKKHQQTHEDMIIFSGFTSLYVYVHTYIYICLLVRVRRESSIVVQDSLLDFHYFIISRKKNQSGTF